MSHGVEFELNQWWIHRINFNIWFSVGHFYCKSLISLLPRDEISVRHLCQFRWKISLLSLHWNTLKSSFSLIRFLWTIKAEHLIERKLYQFTLKNLIKHINSISLIDSHETFRNRCLVGKGWHGLMKHKIPWNFFFCFFIIFRMLDLFE